MIAKNQKRPGNKLQKLVSRLHLIRLEGYVGAPETAGAYVEGLKTANLMGGLKATSAKLAPSRCQVVDFSATLRIAHFKAKYTIWIIIVAVRKIKKHV